jgi:hypothetical protein
MRPLEETLDDRTTMKTDQLAECDHVEESQKRRAKLGRGAEARQIRAKGEYPNP